MRAPTAGLYFYSTPRHNSYTDKGGYEMFENQVLEIVKETLGNAFAEFYNGTLFVHCSKAQGEFLRDTLLAHPVLANDGYDIILSQLASESIYDFV